MSDAYNYNEAAPGPQINVNIDPSQLAAEPLRRAPPAVQPGPMPSDAEVNNYLAGGHGFTGVTPAQAEQQRGGGLVTGLAKGVAREATGVLALFSSEFDREHLGRWANEPARGALEQVGTYAGEILPWLLVPGGVWARGARALTRGIGAAGEFAPSLGSLARGMATSRGQTLTRSALAGATAGAAQEPQEDTALNRAGQAVEGGVVGAGIGALSRAIPALGRRGAAPGGAAPGGAPTGPAPRPGPLPEGPLAEGAPSAEYSAPRPEARMAPEGPLYEQPAAERFPEGRPIAEYGGPPAGPEIPPQQPSLQAEMASEYMRIREPMQYREILSQLAAQNLQPNETNFVGVLRRQGVPYEEGREIWRRMINRGDIVPTALPPYVRLLEQHPNIRRQINEGTLPLNNRAAFMGRLQRQNLSRQEASDIWDAMQAERREPIDYLGRPRAYERGAVSTTPELPVSIPRLEREAEQRAAQPPPPQPPQPPPQQQPRQPISPRAAGNRPTRPDVRFRSIAEGSVPPGASPDETRAWADSVIRVAESFRRNPGDQNSVFRDAWNAAASLAAPTGAWFWRAFHMRALAEMLMNASYRQYNFERLAAPAGTIAARSFGG